MKSTKLFFLPVILLLTIISCKNDDPTTELPETYNFTNVSFSGQTERLNMLAEMTTEMKKANSGETVDGALLAQMFANDGDPWTSADLNVSEKQLKNKCYLGNGDAMNSEYVEYLIDQYGAISDQAVNTWAPGQAGVATSGTKSYFFNEKGVEYTQLIEKLLMGAVFYYQACEVYTRPGKIGDQVDNDLVTEGTGTDMEHHWDEAFGYFGAPVDLTIDNYDAKVDAGEARYYAKYAGKGQDAELNTVEKCMTQFIKGRHGISNKNNTDRDDAASQVRKEWEMIVVTTAIHYLNGAVSDFADDALRNHQLSEAYTFILALYYNSDKLITNQDLSTLRAYFENDVPGAPYPVASFLDVTLQDLVAARDLLSAVYELDSVKEIL